MRGQSNSQEAVIAEERQLRLARDPEAVSICDVSVIGRLFYACTAFSSIRRFQPSILKAVADHLIFKWSHRADLLFNQRLLGAILQKSDQRLTFLQRYIHLIFLPHPADQAL